VIKEIVFGFRIANGENKSSLKMEKDEIRNHKLEKS
jgi:hypothetical protein